MVPQIRNWLLESALQFITSFLSTTKNWSGAYRAIIFVYLPTNSKFQLWSFDANVRAQLLSKNYRRDFSSIRSWPRKAFDLVDHKTLIRKLSTYKCSQSSLQWFITYLEFHQQTIDYGHGTSLLSFIKSGVPQGSIFGPLLFLLFIMTCHCY